MDSVSYSLGVLLGKNLQQQGVDKVDAATLAAAISDVMGNQALKIDANEANRIVQNYMQAQQSKKYEKNDCRGQSLSGQQRQTRRRNHPAQRPAI
ncbi:MAG TPA: FKBP-type peptidyl-prolyl cis-trans isomerase N-terminal domain-containing protein [Saprospiraceae bacterium]|nr:FKBP-type peptidyl-prolyl cis-trans isomerase N-terminal domain-containing protein [Saprospiraceae bacterium]